MQKYDYSTTSALDIVTKHSNLETSDKKKEPSDKSDSPLREFNIFCDVLRGFFT